MSLKYGFDNARDLFEKLKRDAEKLGNEVTSDNMFNFIVTAYHIKKWIENDDSDSNKQDIRDKAKELQKTEEIINICENLAKANKHFKLDPPRQEYFQTPSEVTSKKGFGEGRLGRGGCGQGEEEIIIIFTPLDDQSEGRKFNILDFKREVVEFWQNFFEENGL
ncbi:MAG: hypothetical protein ACRCU2_15830 [Planktothrix sp.]